MQSLNLVAASAAALQARRVGKHYRHRWEINQIVFSKNGFADSLNHICVKRDSATFAMNDTAVRRAANSAESSPDTASQPASELLQPASALCRLWYVKYAIKDLTECIIMQCRDYPP